MNITEKKLKTPPTLFNRKEDCCGCTAFVAICPKEAIVMTEDAEGFFYPSINKQLCICCYQCLKVCPIKEAKNYDVRCKKEICK